MNFSNRDWIAASEHGRGTSSSGRERILGCGIAALATLMLTAYSAPASAQASAQADAKRVAQELRAAAGGSKTCPLSAGELSGLMGAKVKDAITIGGGCAFDYAGSDENAAVLEILPASSYGPGGGKPADYKLLPGIGDAAWIGRAYQNGWQAQAKRGDKFVHVAVGGKSGGRDVAISVLKAALAKI